MAINLGKERLLELQRLKTQPALQRTQTIKKAKSDKRLQGRWAFKSKVQRFFGIQLSSSFVSELQYLSEENKVYVILSNKKYTFLNVPEAIFTAWTKGASTCVTSDSGKKKRWWIGKTPSLGAFFNTHIKPKYTYVRGWL